MDSNLTADSALLSTTHDRERRVERQIEKITLQEARRYGMSEKQSNGRIKYTYAGHVFIYDSRTNKAISSWKIDPNRRPTSNSGQPRTDLPKKKKKEPKSGTRFYKPNMIQKSQDHAHASLTLSHEEVTADVYKQKEKWASHTVIVVDMSGSMREDDVDGARCRADGVWTTLARDYVKQQLEKGTCSVFDLVSVVAMRTTAQVVIHCEPITYVLYNKLVQFREWENMRPSGHGFYKPAMEKAAELLAINANGTCSLTLMFFSDGKPSDFYKDDQPFSWVAYNEVRKELVEVAGSMGSNFGRRLNFVCVGMAGQEESFETLEKMAEEAKMFGSQATFDRPDLNTHSLSEIVNSSVASSLASKTEMSSLKTGKARSVRTDVERERLNAPDDKGLNENWRVFQTSSEDQYVQNVWVWSANRGDFARVIDPRCNVCYKEVATQSYSVPTYRDDQHNRKESKGDICQGCGACFFCTRCMLVGGYQSHRSSSECAENAIERRAGFLIGGANCPLSYNVAWKKQAFGEGAERLAFKFRFVDKRGQFTGPVMVAKESRFVEDLHDSSKNYLRSHRHAYHKTFMRTQAAASRFAQMFNKAIETQEEVPIGVAPQIAFLKPSIFELEDRTTATSYNVLVEPLIEGKYKKFSDNFGAQAGIKRDFAEENRGIDLTAAAALLGRKYKQAVHGDQAESIARPDAPGGLGIIAEGSSEDEEEDDDSDSENEESPQGSFGFDRFDASALRNEDYLQAFSHFSYVRSGGKLMVVDLQGTLQTTSGRNKFVLTDPAIHHRQKRHDKSRQYGRTDLGRKGMRAFFESHVCNGVCRLFRFQEKNTPEALDRLSRDRVTSNPV